MKKFLTFSLLAAVGFCGIQLYNSSDAVSDNSTPNSYIPTQVERPAAVRWNARRANIETGKVEAADVKKAQMEIAKFRQENAQKAGSLIKWEEMGPNNVGGRTRSILFDKSDSKIMYTGGVSGGFWKSTDGASNWKLSQNSVDSGCTNVTSMTQTNDGTIYVGTGSSFEFLLIDTQGNIGTGVFKSTDKGETFTPIATTSTWNAVNEMASNGTRVFAATNAGLYKSDDGSNWDRPVGLTNASVATAVHVASDGTVYAAVGNVLAKSTDGGNSFTAIPASNFLTNATANRKIFVSCESQPNVVYLAYLVNSCDVDIYKSTNAGETWSRVVDGGPAVSPVGVASAGICQGEYDLALAVSPTNPDEIYFGGLTLWKWTPNGGAYQVDNYYGDIFSETYVHADKHAIAYKPGSGDEMFIGCDGGIFKTNDASSPYPVYQHKSRGLNTVQFYSIGAGLDGSIIGGAQDNGTSLLDYGFNSFQAAQDIAGGDGGYCEISDINPQIMLASSQEGNMVLSTNGGNGFGSFLNGGTACSQNLPVGCGTDGPDEDGDGAMDNANFIQAFSLWEDTELYHKIMDTEVSKDANGNYVFPTIVEHNGQTFIITNDLDLVASQKPGHPGNATCSPTGTECTKPASNYGNYQAGAVNVYTESVLYIGFDEATGQIIPSPKFIRSKFIASNNNGDMWMTYDLHNLGVTPFFVNLGKYNSPSKTAGGSVFSYAFSKDGDHVFLGTSNGKVTRVSGLNSLPQVPVTVDLGSQMITGLSVNPIFPNQVIASAGNTGASANIYRANNALNSTMTFESIQGNLPKFPLFDCAVVGTGPLLSDLIVGGEYGVYFGQDLGGGNIVWSEENGKDADGAKIGLVPVERIRVEPMARNNNIVDFKASDYSNCKVIYIGTHGRGAFRTTSLVDGNCQKVVSLAPITPTNNTNINDASFEMNVYPNPAYDEVNIDFELTELARVKVNIYDVQGRLLKTAADITVVGKQTVQADITELTSGNYIISLETSKGSSSTQFAVVK